MIAAGFVVALVLILVALYPVREQARRLPYDHTRDLERYRAGLRRASTR